MHLLRDAMNAPGGNVTLRVERGARRGRQGSICGAPPGNRCAKRPA
jgi:hypothetical protein